VHREERTTDVYELVPIGKQAPQWKTLEAGPAGCQSESEEGPPVVIALTCRHVTIAQFAEVVREMDREDLKWPVVGSSELSGFHDITLRWTGYYTYHNERLRGNNPGLSLENALDKQLGLKLVPARRPMPALVVEW